MSLAEGSRRPTTLYSLNCQVKKGEKVNSRKCIGRGLQSGCREVDVLNLGFTFNGTAASEKGDKIQRFICAQRIKILSLFGQGLGFVCIKSIELSVRATSTH